MQQIVPAIVTRCGVKMNVNEKKAKLSLKYAFITLVLLVVEVLIALFVHDKFIRPYVGDVLVTILICCFLRIFICQGVRLLPLYVFVFAAGVEVLQYFRIVELLGLSDNRFFSILIGSVFDVRDIVCYGVGCVAVFVVERMRRRTL